MDLDRKLALDAFKTDSTSHILIRHEICRSRCTRRYCLYVCPAGLYRYDQQRDEIQVEYAGCLECGTCKLACDNGAIEWSYPRGAYGVQYRYG